MSTTRRPATGPPSAAFPVPYSWACLRTKTDHFDEPGLAEVPPVPVAQLLADDVPDLPFPSGTDVLQVLWCPFDHEPWDVPLTAVTLASSRRHRTKTGHDASSRRGSQPPIPAGSVRHRSGEVDRVPRLSTCPTRSGRGSVRRRIDSTQTPAGSTTPIWRSPPVSRLAAIPAGPISLTGRCAAAASL